MAKVYLDTMVFAYWIEDSPQYGNQVKALIDELVAREHIICTSVLHSR
ncbi:MAG TPA: hypothetical protein VK934_08555 [Fimbriimonas sp.]|nr:hypothetical protein [Fimbriimonas sp.]